MKIMEFDARGLDAGRVVSVVMSGDIGVVHDVVTEQDATRAIDAVLSWSMSEPDFDTRGGTASPAPHRNFHRIDNNPELSKTKHVFHTFNFENVGALEPQYVPIVNLFESLRQLDNKLLGQRGSLSPFQNGNANFHPQIIHYPKGGGYFERHSHALEPQRIGLIASLTKKGEHFEKGGTLFWNDGAEVDAESAQTLGSVTLFRFDLPHAVSKVDPDAALEFGKPNGRWVAVLPYR